MKRVYGVVSALICGLALQSCFDEPDAAIVRVGPETGAVGGTVLIQGLGFDKDVNDNTVYFNGVQAEVLQASEASLLVRIPDATSGKISIESGGRKAVSPFDFEIVEPSGSWKGVSDFPGDFRIQPLILANDEFAFVGLGVPSLGLNYLKDFWKYSPTTDVWTRLSDFPGQKSWVQSGFIIGGKIYVFVDSLTNEANPHLWSYNIEADSWTELATNIQPEDITWPYDRYQVVVSVPYQSKGIILFSTSSGEESALKVYDPADNTWANANVEFPIAFYGYLITTPEKVYSLDYASLAQFDFNSAESATEDFSVAPFSIINNGFFGSANGNLYFGSGRYYDDLDFNNVSGYSPETKTWFVAAPTPFLRYSDYWWNAVRSFELKGKCYVVFGDDENGPSNKMFEFTP